MIGNSDCPGEFQVEVGTGLSDGANCGILSPQGITELGEHGESICCSRRVVIVEKHCPIIIGSAAEYVSHAQRDTTRWTDVVTGGYIIDAAMLGDNSAGGLSGIVVYNNKAVKLALLLIERANRLRQLPGAAVGHENSVQ